MNLEKAREAVEIILSDRKSYSKSLNYAVNYCSYFMGINDEKEAKVQALYILSNISGWRHEKAKEVRATLKKFAGIK